MIATTAKTIRDFIMGMILLRRAHRYYAQAQAQGEVMAVFPF
jgi:hypothetical protein